MTSYTITITPDDGSGTTTTLRLDASGTTTRITDLHLHASDGLSTGHLPTVDFGLLLRAVTPTTPAPTQIAATPAASASDVHTGPEVQSQPEVVPDVPADPAASPTTDAVSEAAAAVVPAPRTARAGRRTAKKTTPAPAEPAKKTRASRGAAAAKKATGAPSTAPRSGRKAANAVTTKKTATTTGERVYRRMPDDFAEVYQQAGSAAAVADHYQVPRHTAHGWIRRLRTQTATLTN